MESGKKSDAEINKILNELRNLESYDTEEYKKKLAELKKNDSSAYFKIMIMLNLDKESSYSSTGANQQLPIISKNFMPNSQAPPVNLLKKNQNINPANKISHASTKTAKKSFEKKSNPAVFAILSMAIIGILLLTAIGFFWITNPPVSDTSRNSLRLGYQIFNELNNTYLNYTFLYNSSDLEFIGKQYYYIDNLKFTAIIQFPERDVISKRQNNFLYYDLSGNYSKISTASLRMNNSLISSLYDEVYNLVNNHYTNESGREGVWNLTDIPCAPLFFEIDINNEEFSDLTQLRYEMCLDNNGIPIAIAKESIYSNHYEVIIAYLESTNPQISEMSFCNKTLSYWKNLVIDDY
jgi:hypothetical protein